MSEANNAAQQAGQAIIDDHFYYRDDGEQIDKIVLRNALPCVVFLGLRRFGKSSFLFRIQRWCNGVNSGWEPRKARAGYAGVKAYLIEGLAPSKIEGQIENGLSDPTEGIKTKIFLIDDIQGYGSIFNTADGDRAARALKKLFDKARTNPAAIRIVMAEPTSHLEWISIKDGPGAFLRRMCGEEFAFVYATMSALNEGQAHALLTGSPANMTGDKDKQINLTPEQTVLINRAFGGNPWFLNYAYKHFVRRGEKDLVGYDENWINEQIVEINNAINLQEKDSGLVSIYNSLCMEEQFIVDLLADRTYTLKSPERKDRASRENRESITLFAPGEEDKWRPESKRFHHRLGVLGLLSVDNKESIARSFIGNVFFDYVHKSVHGGTPLLDRMQALLQKSDSTGRLKDLSRRWASVIVSRSPVEKLQSRTVIHHFGDLLFEDVVGGHGYWKRYISWIKRLKETNSDDAPHFIVICGNLIPGDVSGDPSTPKYRKQIGKAFDALAEARDFLKPVGVDHGKASASQIIIVPGVLDVNWPAVAGCTKEERSQLLDAFGDGQSVWESVVADYDFSVAKTEPVSKDGVISLQPTPIEFDVARVAFLPIDTVAVSGVREELGNIAACDILDIRRRIRLKFGRDWVNLREEKAGAETKKAAKGKVLAYEERWKRFLSSTWRYAFRESDKEASNPDATVKNDQVDTATFRWIEYRPVGEVRGAEITKEEWVSEAGFVSQSVREALGDGLRKANEDPQPPITIAVMHHAPRQLRRSTLVTFYQSYRLRKALSEANVNWVLHGNSFLQQQVEEAVSLTGRKGPSAPDSQRMRMLSAGSFSTLPDYLPASLLEDPDEEVPSRPSFNQIEITPPDRLNPNRPDFHIDVKFWFWPSADAADPDTR